MHVYKDKNLADLIQSLDEAVPTGLSDSSPSQASWNPHPTPKMEIKSEPSDVNFMQTSNNRSFNNNQSKSRFNGNCNFCGLFGHKFADCRRRLNMQGQQIFGVKAPTAPRGPRQQSSHNQLQQHGQNSFNFNNPWHSNSEGNVMAFGSQNAPETFQRLMNTVLSGLTWKQCLAYIDDVLIFSKGESGFLKQCIYNALPIKKLISSPISSGLKSSIIK